MSETPAAPTSAATVGPKRPLRSRGYKALLVFIAIGFGYLIYASMLPGIYDGKTKELAEKVSHFNLEQWKRIYDESQPLFEKYAEEARKSATGKHVLWRTELPPSVKNLGYDKFYVTPEGVFYDHIGSGPMQNFTFLQIIYEAKGTADQGGGTPAFYLSSSRNHDRKGIWFQGVGERRWVYEVK